jgi:hypothetical protein
VDSKIIERLRARFGGGKSKKYQEWQLIDFLSYKVPLGRGKTLVLWLQSSLRLGATRV